MGLTSRRFEPELRRRTGIGAVRKIRNYKEVGVMKRLAGFSLVELLLVVTVMLITMTVAVPSFANLIAANEMTSQINRFIGGLYYARSEAIKRQQRVVICRSSDGQECAPTGAWDQGWLIYVDRNNDAQHDVTEPVLNIQRRIGTGTLIGNRMVSSYLSYRPDGVARSISGALQMGTFVVCDQRGYESGKAIILAHTGRVRTVAATKSSARDCLTG